MFASFKGHVEIVRELCERGANVNAAMTDDALMGASQNGHLERGVRGISFGGNTPHRDPGAGACKCDWPGGGGHTHTGVEHGDQGCLSLPTPAV